MDQRTIISLLRRTSLPATICLIVLVGMLGVFGSLRPAHTAHAAPAVVGGIAVPAGGTFVGNNTNETFTYNYASTPIAIKPEAEVDESETPTCTASLATSGSVGLTSFTFNPGLTKVSCTAPEDSGEAPDTGTFTVIVVEHPVFDNLPADQTKIADNTDTATFTFDPVTAQEPGVESGENISVSCYTNDFAHTLVTSPITRPTHALGQSQNGGSYMFICTATDTTDNSSFNGFFTLTVLDEKTVLSNPGPQTATATANDSAFVSYPAVTPTETPSGESDGQPVGCFWDNPNATSTNGFVSSGTFPIGSPPSDVMPTT